MKKNYKKILIVALAGLFAWQLYQKLFLSNADFYQRGRVSSVAVEVAPVRKTSINDVGFFTGTLLPRAQFIVAPKITGRLEKIFVNIGDLVKFNQLIALLDDDEYVQQVGRFQAELDVAKANVEEARSAFEMAKREFERAKILREKKLLSESNLDAAQGQFKAQEAKNKVALAQVTQREAALKEAKVRLSYTKIRASWEENNKNILTRVVGERFVHEGALLTPNTSIVSILDINSLIGVIHVIERDYPKVKVSMEATVTTDAFPGKTFKGKIIRIAPMLRETSREARVEIEILNQDFILKPGMFIRTQIVFATHDDALVVPVSSLSRREEKQGIFLADTSGMVVSFVPVRQGIVNNEFAEIIEPAISGYVVVMGQHLLEHGSAISIPGKNIEDSSRRKSQSSSPDKNSPKNIGGGNQ